MSTRYTKSMKADYDLSKADYEEIVATAAEDFWTCDDGTDYNATLLAENVAHDLDHDEWLDVETHPLWDICAEACLAAEAEDDDAPHSLGCWCDICKASKRKERLP